MPKLLYISLMRLHTEQAHGLQIMQNCEAFAAAGCHVTLWTARSWNTRDKRPSDNPFQQYDVAPSFTVRRLPCIDLFPLFKPDGPGSRFAFYLLMLSYALVMLLMLPFVRADIYYSRDEFLLVLLSWLKPKRSLAYEAHQFRSPARGESLQKAVCKRVGSVIAVTPPLREHLVQHRCADPKRAIAAHDGIRRERYENLPDRDSARRRIGWDRGAFIVGYVGSLRTIRMEKGVEALLSALTKLDDAHLALVGGPAQGIRELREQWLGLGMPAARFLDVGRVPPAAVPLYLRAFDVCAMPHPATEHFAHFTSPLKLFEYMAAGGAIVASDLPSWSDVLHNRESALLVPPDDIDALARAIDELRHNPSLRRNMGERARALAMEKHTWSRRAETILSHIASA